jgi:hypothetical protein
VLDANHFAINSRENVAASRSSPPRRLRLMAKVLLPAEFMEINKCLRSTFPLEKWFYVPILRVEFILFGAPFALSDAPGRVIYEY